MSAEDEIRELLERKPCLSSMEIGRFVGCTQRHVRRTLSSMPDVVCERRGRSVVYSRKFGDDGAGGSSPSAEVSSASFASAADALTIIDDASSATSDASASIDDASSVASDASAAIDDASPATSDTSASSVASSSTTTTTQKKGTFCRPSGGPISGKKGSVSGGDDTNRGHDADRGHNRGHFSADRGHDDVNRGHDADRGHNRGHFSADRGHDDANRGHNRGHFSADRGHDDVNRGHNRGHFSADRGHNRGHFSADRGHFSDSGSVLGQDCPSFLNLGGNSHGNGTFYACSGCPFVFGSLERDAVGFVLVDESFRNLLLSHARKNAWDVKVRGKNVYIRVDHLSFHLGHDSVVFYSDEPFDLEWICEWVKAEFAGEFDDESLESLLLRIRHPQRLSRDELTVVIEDLDLADAMVSVTELYFRPDGVLYFEPPNGTTPAFRMYRRGELLRVEFDARNSSQSVSAFFMRNELLAMLPGVVDSPGLFFSFLSRYYDPGARTIVIDNSGVAEILRNVMRDVVREMLTGKMGDPFVCPDGKEVFEAMDNSGNEDGGEGKERKEREEKKKEVRAEEAGVKANGADEAGDAKEVKEAEEVMEAKDAGEDEVAEAFGKVDLVCRSLEELDCFVPEKVAGILADCFDVSVDAGYFFLAAWSVWSGRRFKGRVTSEEVLGVLERQGVFVDGGKCGGLVRELLRAGVFEERVGFDVCFSPVGIRLGKKVEGFWRG